MGRPAKERIRDEDSAGVYFMTVEEFEGRPAAPGSTPSPPEGAPPPEAEEARG